MRRTHYINIPNRFSFYRIPYLAALLLCLFPAIISGIIVIFLRNSKPDTVDTVYSSRIFSGISSFLGTLFGVTKRSVASVILILLVLISFGVIISFIFFMIRNVNFKNYKFIVRVLLFEILFFLFKNVL